MNVNPYFSSRNSDFGRVASMTSENIVIEQLAARDEAIACQLIRDNLSDYGEASAVIVSTLRRLEQFHELYAQPGSIYLVAKDRNHSDGCIGGAGIGPLHGLSPVEGVGELRDLVVAPDCRGKGIGSRLLKRCLDEAKRLGYKRLYLETTPQMEHAQKLFIRHGFRPVTEGAGRSLKTEIVPCYFILENLN